MKIVKGGITREIDEKRLQEYKNKGYQAEEEPVINSADKPLEQMKTAELKAFAEQNGIDISAAKNKPEVLEIILAATQSLEQE